MLGKAYSIVLLLVLFLALVFLLVKPIEANVTVRCKERERQALLNFKQSLAVVNESDTGFYSWGSGDDKGDCCNWTGVKCNDSTGHVVTLNLNGVIGYVTGTINSSLLELPYLSYLDLSSNHFNESCIPEFIGSLRELTYLYLSDSEFSGPIPSQLGNLSRLVTLDLSSNNLTASIPESFGNLVALRDLSLSDNLLDGEFPKSLWNICGLHSLDLVSNNLGGDVFGFLQTTSLCTTYSLEELQLYGNQLTGSVPNEITKLSSLQVLRVGNNSLSGSISKTIGQLSNLMVWEFSGNSFDKVIISEAHFQNLSKLNWLDLSDTSLALKFSSDWIPPFQLTLIFLRSCKLGPSFPQWIRSQNRADAIDFSASGISDSIPSWFWHTFPPVHFYLNLSFNQITGSFPQYLNVTAAYIGCYFDCTLDLRSNNFTGSLPKHVNYFGYFQYVDLSKNKLFGSITSICEYMGITGVLDLSSNLFSGAIPNCTEWSDLSVLNLSENKLSGSVPMSIWSPKYLQMLSLRSNSLSGPLPSSIWNCSGLRFLDLSNNELSGNIPEWIGQCFPSLIFLSLENNQFHGNIPDRLCELSNLQVLDLSQNCLSGSIPQCLSNFTSMSQNVSLNRTIDHYINTVRGYPEPDFLYVIEALLTWRGMKQKYARILGLLLVIDLSSNQLTGDIPDELTSLRELVALNLSRNSLTGKVPQKIGQLRQLQMLDLSRNKFSGSIPPGLSQLTFLGTLDLSYNYLSGEIPKGTQLQGFDPSTFSHNNGLCGPPITPNCTGPVEPPQGQPERDQDNVGEFMKWFYDGMGLGFAVGFWGFCGVVFFKRSWRHSYFRFLDNLKDWLYLAFVLQKARLERRIRA